MPTKIIILSIVVLLIGLVIVEGLLLKKAVRAARELAALARSLEKNINEVVEKDGINIS